MSTMTNDEYTTSNYRWVKTVQSTLHSLIV